MAIRLWGALLALTISAGCAGAAPKVAVLPFDLIQQQSEEDFFTGAPKQSPEEVARLKLVRDEFEKMLAASGKYAIVDVTPVATEVEAAAPLSKCNGCEMDFAKKLGVDFLYLGVLEKASATLLNMSIIVVDVAQGKPVKQASAVVQGNTDDAWLGAARWLVRNRMLASGDGK